MKKAVFILLGQSNAVGHGIAMDEKDRICKPLKNVFGLHRADNQSFAIKRLTWRGYESAGMNLAEEQDHTWSVANCLARQWQDRIDGGENLPDLYIIQIAIGAQGVTEKYMWHPDRPEKLVPGKLGEVDISLFPFTCHILSLLDKSLEDYEIIGLHWRGGENDACEDRDMLEAEIGAIYRRMLDTFNRILQNPPTVLHGIHCPDRMDYLDATGGFRNNMYYINEIFKDLEQEYPNVSVFDVRKAPFHDPTTPEQGLFIEDKVHYTPRTNRWVAEQIIKRSLIRAAHHSDKLPEKACICTNLR